MVLILAPFPSYISQAQEGGSGNAPVEAGKEGDTLSTPSGKDDGLSTPPLKKGSPYIPPLEKGDTGGFSGEKSVVDDTYIIGPSDVLEIQVWKEPDFSRVVPVRADGMITLPLINDIEAAGLTPLQLKKELEQKIKDFVEVPEISVIVKESLSRRIYIIGKVAKQGEYLLTKDMTVLQALSVAGGLAEWADSDDIVIIRRAGGEEKRILFDYGKVISGRKLEQNIYLQPNDTIIIP
ncbi:MAG: polysaccharide biosynthesis/export family protein [Thermodesulfobacteriota bacterium]